jgi:branched-chain amino acid transport system permease protein
MLGMYATFALFNIAWLRLDPYLSILVVFPAMFILGVAVQRFIIQPLQNEPMMQVFATFGLLMVMQNIILALTAGHAVSVRIDLSAKTIALGSVQVSVVRAIALLAATGIVLGLYWMLNNTMFGRGVRAVAQDRRAARLMGINVERTFMLTFGIGAALAGLAGSLLTPIYTLSPQIGGSFILPAFAVVVLGGLGSVAGAFIGGFIVGLTETFAGFYLNPELKQAIWFMVFILMLLIRPSGLFGHVGAEEVGLREQD